MVIKGVDGNREVIFMSQYSRYPRYFIRNSYPQHIFRILSSSKLAHFRGRYGFTTFNIALYSEYDCDNFVNDDIWREIPKEEYVLMELE